MHMDTVSAAKPAASLLTAADLRSRTQLCRSTIYRQVRDGKFPAPIRVGRRTLWPAGAVEAWIDAQVAQAA